MRHPLSVAAADPYQEQVGAFLRDHAALVAADRWEPPGPPPVRELLAAAGAAGLLAPACAVPGRADHEEAVWRAVRLHTAFAQVGNGAPGAAMLTHLEVGTRLLHGLPSVPSGLLAGALAGQCTVALAVTEPDAGTDLARLSTVVDQPDGLAVTGEKWFVSNAPFADRYAVLATDPRRLTGSREGPALVLVDAGAPGLRVTAIDSAGHPGLTGRVRLDAAPVSAVLAPAGRAMLVLGRHWVHERVMLAVRMVELAGAVLDHAAAHSADRWTFGRPLLANQYVQFLLAELLAEVEEGRALVRQAARLLGRGACPAAYAAAAKHRAAAVLYRVADRAVQLAGADGYRTGHPAERALRDATGLALAGGADELMLEQVERGM